VNAILITSAVACALCLQIGGGVTGISGSLRVYVQYDVPLEPSEREKKWLT
jgi:hypothetical protein